MAAPSMSGLFRVGVDILKSFVSEKNKTVLVQTGDVAHEATESDNVEWWQQVGFISRPPKADAGKQACQGIIIRRSNQDVCVASRDLRGQELAGSIAEGETCVYGAGSDGKAQGRLLIKKNGSINLYTRKGNTSSGDGMGIFINPDDDSISIVNSKGHGIVIKDDGVYVTAKDSALSLKSSGDCSLVGKGKAQVDGSGIVLGSVAVPGVNSALVGVTGIAGAASAKVLIQLA